METTTTNIQNVNLSQIIVSDFNPRKTFNEVDIAELAESIKEQGVLQPIMVRKKGKKLEIIYGERRYRAALLAELKQIPAIIRELTDAQAREIAITENLQRKDVEPLEEAMAYQYLLDTLHYDIAQLGHKFGKSESFIRGRLRLNALVSSLADLLRADTISIGTALEFSKYSEEIQTEIFHTQYENGGSSYNNWANLKTKEISKQVAERFNAEIDKFSFDKSDCAKCQYNSNSFSLFADAKPMCLNRSCLDRKNTDYLIEKIQFVIKTRPLTRIYQNYYHNEQVVSRLQELGYEIEAQHLLGLEYPIIVDVLNREDYDNEEMYQEAELQRSVLTELKTKIDVEIESGKTILLLFVGMQNFSLRYIKGSQLDKTDTKEDPIEKLNNQDKRNQEIAVEHKVEDVKKILATTELTGDFSQKEDDLIYLFMLDAVRRIQFEKLGLMDNTYYLSVEDKVQIFQNLTDDHRNIIRREFLLKHFNQAFGSELISEQLFEFARLHCPNELGEIETKHQNVYEKRKVKIEEKKKALSGK